MQVGSSILFLGPPVDKSGIAVHFIKQLKIMTFSESFTLKKVTQQSSLVHLHLKTQINQSFFTFSQLEC